MATTTRMRNCFGEAQKEKFYDLKLSSFMGEGQPLAASLSYLAVNWDVRAGGVVGSLSLSDIGKRRPNVTLCKGHKGPINDVEFSPFYETLFASASDDCTIKIWDTAAQNETGEKHDSVATLTGHEKKVYFATWNPVADWILASGSADGTLKIWNVEKQANAFTARHPSALHHVAWNFDGSLVASTCKDKMIRVLDPRRTGTVGEFTFHEGNRAAKVLWLGGACVPPEQFVSCGNTKAGEREFAVWDIRQLEKPIQRTTLDRGSGVINPFWDYSSGLVFFAGRGDGNIRLAEFTDGGFHMLQEFRASAPAKGTCFLPKRAVDVMKNEMMRALRISSPSEIEAVSFLIPRRSTEFQPDLYPDCHAGEPALSTEKWLQQENAAPVFTPMGPPDAALATEPKVRRPHLEKSQQALQSPVNRTPAVLKKQLSTATEVIGGLMEEAEHRDDTLRGLISKNSALTQRVYQLEKEVDELKQRTTEGPPVLQGKVATLEDELQRMRKQIADFEELYQAASNALRVDQNSSN